ncbi:MAG: alpha/beta hydrolase [Simkaniaceae bacterium]|nr:alpha/beta hydrolase [Simkaniaceae bacterium]
MAFIKINQSKYYYELYGDGIIPLILISGYTCDHEFYFPCLDFLKPHFKILVFDNLGVGQTTDNHKVLDAELMAQEIVQLTKELGLIKPNVVGQSMGGTIAQVIGSKYGEAIDNLVLLTTSSHWRTAMLKALGSLLNMRKKELEFDFQFEALVPWIFGEAFLSSKENIAIFKEILLEANYPQSLENQIRQFNVLCSFDGRSQLKNIQSNTLIIYGNEDLISLPHESEFLHKGIKNSTLVEFDCGHVITAEQPERLAHQICEFLA